MNLKDQGLIQYFEILDQLKVVLKELIHVPRVLQYSFIVIPVTKSGS